MKYVFSRQFIGMLAILGLCVVIIFGFYHILTTDIKMLLEDIFLAFILLLILLINHKHILRKKELLKAKKKLTELAYYDLLTGLPNKIFLASKFQSALFRSRQAKKNLALYLIDIDKLKNVNDSLGLEIGDRLLQALAARLVILTRKNDLLIHFESDEFILLVSDIAQTGDITAIAQKISYSMNEPFEIGKNNIHITVSIGISAYPDDGNDLRALLRNANIAVLKAKEIGRNNYQFCTPEMIAEMSKNAKLDSELHQALLNHEFKLLYQPKISLKTNEIVGIEALIRWMRPGVGLVEPDEFISIIEANGLIVPIGEWMLHAVCEQAKQWQNEGLPSLAVTINVSVRQLNMSDFVAVLKRILKETQFDPALLEIEITETVAIENSYVHIAALRALKRLGIQITLDDFGTGYSCFSSLKLFTIDKLKIDKSFVSEIKSDADNPSIINAIIAMAHSLNMRVVAEGVETDVQAEMLKRCQCDEAQGYYYSPPVSAGEIKRFFNK